MTKLLALLKENQIDIAPDFSGQFIRNGSQWFVGREEASDGSLFRFAFFGDFARSKSLQWEDSGSEKMSGEQIEKFNAFKIKAHAENQKARVAFWEVVREEVQAEWENFATLGTSPYFEKKNILGSLYGCRLEAHERGARTIVPARDVLGELWGYQTIFSEKLDIGDKVFRKGARKEACFHTLGRISGGLPIYITEGIATAVFVYKSLGADQVAVLSCFDAGNLIHVARAIRMVYPNSPLIFCADNDQYPSRDGKIYHTGRIKAEQAAKAVGNSEVRLAQFKDADLGTKPTDFDDVFRLYGSEAVKAQLTEILSTESPVPIGPPTKSEAEKVPPAISEARLVKALLEQFGDNLVRQGKDFFEYTGTHWEHMEPLSAPDHFKRLIDGLAQGKLKFKDIQSAYNRFFIHVTRVPHGVSLFNPNPFKQNFRNGTLSLEPQSNGTFKINFAAHKREDYLIHCHEFNYQDDADLNPEFEQALDRIWAGEPDIEMKKQAYFEVLGACLVSAFRKLVLFVGPPKTGKSTLVLFAANMVHEDYRCSVDPTMFHGFNLESMAGKLLNYDTDINLVRPITDSILKKVEDRSPMRISRKGISDIYAPIPGMQLFGANRMPVSQEAGEAYNRRMLVFRCDKFQPTGTDYVQDYAQHVWRQNSQGIVARAIEGMKRLAANGGHFTVPDSSRVEIEAWQKNQGDLVQDFLHDVKEGGASDLQTKVFHVPGAKIERSALWESFKAWAEKNSPRTTHLGKIKFFTRVVELGYPCKTVKGTYFFEGFSVTLHDESEV